MGFLLGAGWNLATGFLPSQLPNLEAWYDASSIVGLSNGDAVAAWPDRGPLGRNLTQAVAAEKPSYQQNIINGRPVVRGDNVDDRMDTSLVLGVTGSASRVVYAIYARTADDVGNVPYNWGEEAVGKAWGIDSGNGNCYFYRYANDFDAGARVLNKFEIHTWMHVSGDKSYAYINGAQVGTVAGDPNTSDSVLTIFFRPSTAATRAGIDLAELIVYSIDHNAATRLMVHNYASIKYAIALS